MLLVARISASRSAYELAQMRQWLTYKSPEARAFPPVLDCSGRVSSGWGLCIERPPLERTRSRVEAQTTVRETARFFSTTVRFIRDFNTQRTLLDPDLDSGGIKISFFEKFNFNGGRDPSPAQRDWRRVTISLAVLRTERVFSMLTPI